MLSIVEHVLSSLLDFCVILTLAFISIIQPLNHQAQLTLCSWYLLFLFLFSLTYPILGPCYDMPKSLQQTPTRFGL